MPIITEEHAGRIRGQLTEKYGATWLHEYHKAIEEAVFRGLGIVQASAPNGEPVIQHLPADDSEGGLV